MTTYYDPLSKKWYHEKEKTLGHNKMKTEWPLNYSKKWLPFPLNEQSNHLGPIVGILTSKGTNNLIAGNGPLFLSLQQHLFKLGALPVLFTPDGLNHSKITGYTFFPSDQKWKRITVPLPDVVYNRTPFRKKEKDADYIALISDLKTKKIPFFNPSFINKMEMHQLLKQSPLLKPLLPDTCLLTSKDILGEKLRHNERVYVKPVNSAKGKGIFLITIKENHYSFKGIHLEKEFHTFDELWEALAIYVSREPYMLQEAIDPALYNGLRYDFRILSHKVKDEFKITGIGIRQSNKQQVTTHVPNGGTILPYELFDTEEHRAFFTVINQEIGEILTKNIGLFGEYSLDIGLGSDGKFYLYEINSKPMSFDEEHIENNRIQAICHLCMHLSGFSITP